ncbi:hypothetical protein KP509_37G018900 [Ceratopteris richardii]|nr:hypothetical protein KP509_37G018900 [Ceratopteris richardii]
MDLVSGTADSSNDSSILPMSQPEIHSLVSIPPSPRLTEDPTVPSMPPCLQLNKDDSQQSLIASNSEESTTACAEIMSATRNDEVAGHQGVPNHADGDFSEKVGPETLTPSDLQSKDSEIQDVGVHVSRKKSRRRAIARQSLSVSNALVAEKRLETISEEDESDEAMEESLQPSKDIGRSGNEDEITNVVNYASTHSDASIQLSASFFVRSLVQGKFQEESTEPEKPNPPNAIALPSSVSRSSAKTSSARSSFSFPPDNTKSLKKSSSQLRRQSSRAIKLIKVVKLSSVFMR